jgi:hypothetical protein
VKAKDILEPRTVPCRFCSRQTDATGSRTCRSCWEVYRHLDSLTDIALTDEGRRVVMKACVEALLKLDPVHFRNLRLPTP